MAELKVTAPDVRSWKDIALYGVGALIAIAEQLRAIAGALSDKEGHDGR